MQSSIVELKLQLGDSLASEVEQRAARMNLAPSNWLSLFLAKGRLTPDVEEELAIAQKEGVLFFTHGALNAQSATPCMARTTTGGER